MLDDLQENLQYRSWGIGGVIFGLLTLGSAGYSAISMESTCGQSSETADPQSIAVCTSNFYLASELSAVVGLLLVICGVILLLKYYRHRHAFHQRLARSHTAATKASLLHMELEKLKEMQRQGMINDQEYEQLREKVINE